MPIVRGTDVDADERVVAYCRRLADAVGALGVRVKVDETGQKSADKKWRWVKRGVPLLLELGPRDEAAETVSIRTRLDSSTTASESFNEFVASVVDRLRFIQDTMRGEAAERLQRLTRTDIRDFAAAEKFFQEDQGFLLAKWCEKPECETGLKHLGVTIRCLPDELHSDGTTCLVCGEPASIDAIWAESY